MKTFLIIALLAWSRIAAAATLSVEPVSAGAPVVVQWAGASSARDWIAIYNQGAGDGSFLAWFYVNGVGSGAGNFAGRTAGVYDVRMFANDGWLRIATAQAVVGASTSPLPPPPPPSSGSAPLTVNCPSGMQPSTMFHVCFDGNTQQGIYPRGPLIDAIDDTAHSAHLDCRKARGSRGAPLSVADGDYLCAFYAEAFDGSSYLPAGYLVWKSDGWPQQGKMATTLVFATRSFAGGMSELFFLRRAGTDTSLETPAALSLAVPELKLPRHAPPVNSYLCIDPTGKVFVSQTGC